MVNSTDDAGDAPPLPSVPAASEQPGNAEYTAQAAAAFNGDPDTLGSGATPPEPSQAGAKTLTGGAADLKAVLGSARDGGATVILLWHSVSSVPGASTDTAGAGAGQGACPSAGQAAGQLTGGKLGELLREAQRMAVVQPELRVFLADVGASKANG